MRTTSWAVFALAHAVSGCGLFPSFDKLSGAQRPRDASADQAIPGNHGNGGKSSAPRCGFAESYLKTDKPHRSAWLGAAVAVHRDAMVTAAPLEKNPWPAEAGITAPRQTCQTRRDILMPDIQGAGVIRAYDRVGSGWKEARLEFRSPLGAERSIVDPSLLPPGFMTAVLPAYSLALSDTWLVVGTAGDSSRGPFAGSVHAFQRSGGAWQERYAIENEHGGEGDLFGFAVALSDDLLVVGAPGADASGTDGGGVRKDAGAVHVYRLFETNYVYFTSLTASFVDERAWFGASVAVSPTWLAIGAPLEDRSQFNFPGQDPSFDSTDDSGTVYMYGHEESLFHPLKPIVGTDRNGSLGAAISLYGDELAATAPNQYGTEKVRLFSLSQGSADAAPMMEADLDPKDLNAYLFGFSVALRRDAVIVGAPFTGGTATGDASGNFLIPFYQSSGTAYIFQKDATGAWMTDPCRLKASNAGPCDNFGAAVAASDDYFVVGAPLEDSTASGLGGDGASDDLLDSGAVYVYTTP